MRMVCSFDISRWTVIRAREISTSLKMTSSHVAVITDVVRDGKPVAYSFNSNGRYGQGGLIRERFADRITSADQQTLLDESCDNVSPEKVWAAITTRFSLRV